MLLISDDFTIHFLLEPDNKLITHLTKPLQSDILAFYAKSSASPSIDTINDFTVSSLKLQHITPI